MSRDGAASEPTAGGSAESPLAGSVPSRSGNAMRHGASDVSQDAAAGSRGVDVHIAGIERTEPLRRAIRSYVLRAGRVGPGQERALETLWPKYGVPYCDAPLDLAATFGRQAPVVVEIGFGMGDATARIAEARPGDDFLGIEVHAPGVGALLQRIEAQALANVRIVRHDAVEVLRDMIAPDSLAGVHVYFPDPWHKKKHHKRRLIQPDFVRLLSSRLAPAGYLHCATDWQPYAEQMLQVLGAEPALRNTTDGYAPRPDWRPLTKFENRGLKLGHGVWDLVFSRVTESV